jgi:hypothetical protein
VPYDAPVPVADRVAANEARFAAANDRIAAVAGELEVAFVPFLCECPDPRCSQVARLSLAEYEELRLFANRYVVAPTCAGGDFAGTEIVGRTDRFTVVDRLEA